MHFIVTFVYNLHILVYNLSKSIIMKLLNVFDIIDNNFVTIELIYFQCIFLKKIDFFILNNLHIMDNYNP